LSQDLAPLDEFPHCDFDKKALQFAERYHELSPGYVDAVLPSVDPPEIEVEPKQIEQT
jgi:hypothetical protein